MERNTRVLIAIVVVASAFAGLGASAQLAPAGGSSGTAPGGAPAVRNGAPTPQPRVFHLPAASSGVPVAANARARIERDEAVGRLLASRTWSIAARTRAVEPSGEPPLLVWTDDGWIRAVGAAPGEVYSAASYAATPNPGEVASSFLRAHAKAFGVAAKGVAFRAERVIAAVGRRSVRLKQEFRGIPVFGASAVVQLDAAGDVEFATSDVARDDARMHGEAFSLKPAVSATQARVRAATVPDLASAASDLETSEPVLMIYEPSVIGNFGASRLVWCVEVTSGTRPVNELVLVDAQSGGVAFHFSQIMEAKYRAVYHCSNIPGSTGNLARVEGQAATGYLDVDLAYRYLGDTYDYYLTRFGRDSIDGAGMTLVARTYYCDSSASCPMNGAYWNGTEMRFGQGFAAADDVVAHELTHGVTSSESDLIYWGESGAINESLSDIFGELIDLVNGAGTDTSAVRWRMGEDAPGGALRSMQDPTLYGDPDRRYSIYWKVADGDNRGVHSNSGVGNKLAYLLVDGATFNGQTVAGMGPDLVASLFYEAQVNLLGPGHDYVDLYSVLKQAAVNLGWGPAERANLERACRAVEIAVPTNVVTIFSDGFEGAFPGAWAVYDVSGVGTQWGRSTFFASSGSGSAWCAAGGALARPPGGSYAPNMNTWMVLGPFSLADAAKAWMEFDLWLDVEYSPDGSPYDGVAWYLSADGTNWLGQDVSPPAPPVGDLPDPSRGARELFDLQSALGQSQVWVAFRFYSDGISQYYGAYLDNVLVKKAVCAAPTSPSLTAPSTAKSGEGYTVSWTATSPVGTYEIQESTDPAFGAASTWPWSDTGAVFTRSVVGDTTYYYRVRATDSCGGSAYGSPWSNIGHTVVRAPRALTVLAAGAGAGTVTSDPAGISCGGACGATFSYGTVVTLSAAADAGSMFAGWSGEGCTGTGGCQVAMSQARSVTAFFYSVTPTSFYSVSPCRVVNTRRSDYPAGLGAPSIGAVGSADRLLPLTSGTCGIPSTAVAVALNVTVAETAGAGYLTLYPGDGTAPATSTINFVSGQVKANNVFLPLASDGSGTIKVKSGSTGTLNLLIDVVGYFE